jgi:putative FmdB family regulatory protein
MPTYEYECAGGHRFDLFQRMSDEPRAVCPRCGAEAQRVISGGAGFLFKGEGFYITDYRSDAYKKRASEEAAPAADSSAKKDPVKDVPKKAESGSSPGDKTTSEGT